MQSFNQFLTEDATKNLHLEHLEDLVFFYGIDGMRSGINFLRSIRDMLSGKSTKKVDLHVKWDGCLHKDTLLVTNEGEKTISEIIENWHMNSELMVLSYDEEFGVDDYVPILDCFHTLSEKRWVKIELENGENIICTEDHQFKLENGCWVRASDLCENDDLKISDIINIDANYLYFHKEKLDVERI